MNSVEKKELLSRNIWKIGEVLTYFNISRNEWQKVQVKLEDRPPFKASVYRDEVFALLKTSVKQEMQTLRDVERREL